jgi:hypothetical protein
LGCGLVEFLLGTAKILKKTPIFDLGNWHRFYLKILSWNEIFDENEIYSYITEGIEDILLKMLIFFVDGFQK